MTRIACTTTVSTKKAKTTESSRNFRPTPVGSAS